MNLGLQWVKIIDRRWNIHTRGHFQKPINNYVQIINNWGHVGLQFLGIILDLSCLEYRTDWVRQ